jgi:hypothetical protein
VVLIKFNFEKQFGKGTDPWYEKAERWAKKQKFPISFLASGIIAWLKEKWIDVKVANTMRDIDIQAEEIKKIWEEENYPYPWDGFTQPTIKETPSEVEGLNDIEIEYNKYYHG